MGMPLREVESQTHYTGNDLINYSFVAAYVGTILKDSLRKNSPDLKDFFRISLKH